VLATELTEQLTHMAFRQHLLFKYVRTSGGSRPGVWAGNQIRGRQKVFTFSNTPASLGQSLGIAQKWLPFLGQENGNFYWSNYAIFQGITTLQNRLLSLSHKTFEACAKR